MKTYNVPIFVPHRGCPFDCVFCNQKRITGFKKPVTKKVVKEIIDTHLLTIKKKDAFIEVAFFGGSFTGIPMDEQTELLSVAYEYVKEKKINGIRLSTRPDYINREILDNLKKYGVTTIELGVQSMVDSVLLLSGRGHTADDVRRAVALIREYKIRLGLQMMTGLPGDTFDLSVKTAEEIISLKPDMVRIYPTLTIKDTELENMYNDGIYIPQTLDEAVKLSKTLLLMFEENKIDVIRTGLQSTDEICENGSVVAGPVHSSFGELVESEIYYDMILDKLKACDKKRVKVYVNSKEISKATGNKRRNVERIKKEKDIEIKILKDEKLRKREVRIGCF